MSSEGKDGKVHIFRHPFLQTWGLSLGEFACIFIAIIWNCIKLRGIQTSQTSSSSETSEARPKFCPFIFLPAAIFHQGSRCLIFLSLIFTTASSYQILSGSNLIFACIFGRLFLKKSLPWHKWIGVLIIVGGVATVGLGDFLFEKNKHALNAILGDAFALSAMIFWATQLTYEEKFVKKYNINPIHALGLKGIFSFLILTSLLVGFYFLKVPFDMGQPNGVMEDAIDGFYQLKNNPVLMASYISKFLMNNKPLNGSRLIQAVFQLFFSCFSAVFQLLSAVSSCFL